MNRLILKHGRLVTLAILGIISWFFYRQFIVVHSPLFPFVAILAVVWGLGTFLFLYFWPAITCLAYKRAILNHGLGNGPVPVNRLCTATGLSSPMAPSSSLMATGADDLLYIGGWLNLSREPLVLHVPDLPGRYYSLQLTNPFNAVNFAYVGQRTTGTRASDFLVTGPGWKGPVPRGMTRIASPANSVLVVGRVLMDRGDGFEAVLPLAKQVQVSPLSAGAGGHSLNNTQ